MASLERAGALATRVVSTAGVAPTARRALRASMLLVALALPLATGGTAEAQEAAESTAITTLYTGLLSGVGKETGSQTVSWAMSAMGLAGGDSSQLTAISAELQQINADLEAINATLNDILFAIQDQTCVETQISPSLSDAVNDVTARYGRYEQFIDNASMSSPVPPLESDVQDWQNGVLMNLPADLNAIHNGVYATVSANVITQCAIATAAPYIGAQKTAATFFDDRPSYSQLVNIVNYYYGVMVQGATILAEAYHLQACQYEATHDPQLNCNFTTASTGTSASDVSGICDNPTEADVQNACLAAQEAVTEPGTATGMYERVEEWLTAAGAPYATGEAVTDSMRTFVTGELGLLSSVQSSPSSWDGSYAYLLPKDLFDFTSTVTLNGEHPFNCSSPLTSLDPCGPVGPYSANFVSGDAYAGYDNWKSVTADQLLLLFAPYNDKTSGQFDVSNLVSDYLYSIGFSEATKTSGLIILTANTGKNEFTSLPAICFADTAAPRDKAKQPWCDGIQGEVQGTDNLIDASGFPVIQSKYLDSIGSYPGWYALDINDKGVFKVAPGWFVQVQAKDAGSTSTPEFVDQFHWPVVDVSQLSCQSGKPYLNPGGLLSRCGDDLQSYVDTLLPPPESNTTALRASADTTLWRDQPNRNDGRGPQLRLKGGAAAKKIVIRFDEDRLQRFLAGRVLTSARLRLSSVGRADKWRLEVRPLADNFVEGIGNLADQDFAVRTGATWNCAEDADVSDDVQDCLQSWSRSTFDRTPAHGPFGKKPYRNEDADRRHGLVSWDVTEDLKNGVHAWLIRVRQWAGREPTTYLSREGAALRRDPARAPTLLLEGEHVEAHSTVNAGQGLSP